MTNTKIGITCTTVFHYIHFQRIAEQLTKEGFEVVYVIYTPYHINDRVERLVEMFDKENINYIGFKDLFLNLYKLDAILAPYYLPGFQLIDKSIKKIRLLYGYAKDRWNYAEWNKGFDLVLTYGNYSANHIKQYTEVFNIGHPRQRLNYKETVKDLKDQTIMKETFENKKVLLYCPTWADLSSLQLFMESVVNLSKEYKVIVKLHHGNVLSGNNGIWQALYEQSNVFLFDEYTDLFDLLQFADIVLSDYSGAIFDAMLFKLPIVLIDVIDESIKDTGSVNLKKMQDISIYDDTQVENISLDIRIRDIMPHVRSLEELHTTLNKMYNEKQVPYKHLLDELYSFQDDQAPKRATKAIIELMRKEKENFDNDDSFHILNEKKIESFLNLKKGSNFKIWGAGLTGQILLAWLQNKEINVDGFMDIDDVKIGKEVFGLSISKPELTENILIAVPGIGLTQISKQLSEYGFIEGIDFISIFK